MVSYSLRKNLSCMVMAFLRPKKLLGFFLGNPSPLYSVIPLAMFTLYYEILYIMDYLFKEPGVTPLLTSIVQISSTQYNFYQILLFPLIHVADFFVFGGLLYTGSRLLRLNIDTVKTVLFFVFIFNTIGLFSAFTDTLSFVWESELLIYVHPVTGVVFFGYLTAFIYRQGIQRWKSVVLSVIVLTLALLFRIIFLG